jgi:hypothetical protein
MDKIALTNDQKSVIVQEVESQMKYRSRLLQINLDRNSLLIMIEKNTDELAATAIKNLNVTRAVGFLLMMLLLVFKL